MAINLIYGPSAGALGQVAFTTGRKQFQNKQDERAEDQLTRMIDRQQAQQGDMQRAQFAAQQAAVGRQQNALADLYLGQQRAQQQAQLQAMDRNADQENWITRGQFSANAAQDLEQTRNIGDQQRQQAQQDFLWNSRSAESMEKQVGEMQADLAKKARYLTPEGKQLYNKSMGELRAIQQQRGSIKPDKYAATLGSWMENFQKSGLQDHIDIPPTAQEQLPQDLAKDGEGNSYIRNPDGTWRPVPAKSATAVKPSTPQQAMEQYLVDPAKAAKIWDAAHDGLIEKQKLGWESLGTDDALPDLKEPTEEEVMAEVQRRFELQHKMQQKLLGEAAKPNGDTMSLKPTASPAPVAEYTPQPIAQPQQNTVQPPPITISEGPSAEQVYNELASGAQYIYRGKIHVKQ